MTEASVLSALIAVLRSRFPGAVIFKFHDISTKGMPDIAMTWNGFTTWIEVKLLKKGTSLKDCSEPLQLHTMTSLARQSEDRAVYVVYDAVNKTTALYQPAALAACSPVRELAPDEPGYMKDQLGEHGAICVEKFNHNFVADILEELHAENQ